MASTLQKRRIIALTAQAGRCAYCRCPLWEATAEPLDGFRSRYGLTVKLTATLQCTAEHLIARCEGGTNAPENIVAACLRCNRKRHERAKRLDAMAYFMLVQRRLAAGRWLQTGMRERLTLPR